MLSKLALLSLLFDIVIELNEMLVAPPLLFRATQSVLYTKNLCEFTGHVKICFKSYHN